MALNVIMSVVSIAVYSRMSELGLGLIALPCGIAVGLLARYVFEKIIKETTEEVNSEWSL